MREKVRYKDVKVSVPPIPKSRARSWTLFFVSFSQILESVADVESFRTRGEVTIIGFFKEDR